MNNALQVASTRDNVPYHKDAQAFAQGKDPCYQVGEKSFTRANFIQAANGDVAVAEQLFSLINGQEDPHNALYHLATERAIEVPGYISDDGKHSFLAFQRLSIPTTDQQLLLMAQGWHELSLDFTYTHVWTTTIPDVPVPYGIAFINVVKRSELEGKELCEKGNDHA